MDPRRRTTSDDYLTGAEAAALLGVKRETLYAYASRGLVSSVPGPAGRARRYARIDLEALRARAGARSGHAPVAAGALQWGEPVLESAISRIDAAGPSYRGHRAADLAQRGVRFEAVAELLWTGTLPEGDTRWEVRGLGVAPSKLAALLPRGETPIAALTLALAALGVADPTRFDVREPEELARARVLLRRLAASVAFAHEPSRLAPSLAAPTLAESLLVALGGRRSDAALGAVGRALVVCADHELPVSTFAARVVASSGADLYACLAAGLAALSGPEHGGVSTRVEVLLREVGRPERARAVLLDRLRRGEPIPGFGHRLYPDGDPRLPPLLEAARQASPERLGLRTLFAIVDAMTELRHGPATLDIGLVAVAEALGLPAGSALAFFALGRLAGWVAHVLEQRRAGVLLRPRARYVGS